MDGGFTVMMGGVCVFASAVVVYLLLMIFWPEWVGITGQVALTAERSHVEGSEVADNDPFTGLKR